jgi:hypothetical protein
VSVKVTVGVRVRGDVIVSVGVRVRVGVRLSIVGELALYVLMKN